MKNQGNIQDLIGYLPEPSKIGHHNETCCRRAMSWLKVVDRIYSGYDGGNSPPVWIRDYFQWSPVSWPIYWCDVPKYDALDCGGLAALSSVVMQSRGMNVISAQIISFHPSEQTEVWRRTWLHFGQSSQWISGNYCYHEVCVVLEGELVKIWDPTDNNWLEKGNPHHSYGSIVAIKIPYIRDVMSLRVFDEDVFLGRWCFFN